MYDKFESVVKGSGNIYLFGVSLNIKEYIDIIMLSGGKIKYIFDNDVLKHNCSIQGIKVVDINSEIVNITDNDFIIVTSHQWQEIGKQLELLGLESYIHPSIQFIRYIITGSAKELFGSFITQYTENQTSHIKLASCCCKKEYFETKKFAFYADKLNLNMNSKIIYHRKYWEYTYIASVLDENKLLSNEKKGLGFAVGCEPLPAYFASRGVEVLATDLINDEANAEEWILSGQNAGGDINKLSNNGICSDEIFKRQVTLRNLDMNKIPENLLNFDFCWSSCAIEHLGSLENSIIFLKNMLKTLKPGGIAVHTLSLIHI